MENFLEACVATSKRKGEVTSCDKQLLQAGRHSHNLQREAKAQLLEHCRVLATKDLQNFYRLLTNTENCFKAKSQEEISSAVFWIGQHPSSFGPPTPREFLDGLGDLPGTCRLQTGVQTTCGAHISRASRTASE